MRVSSSAIVENGKVKYRSDYIEHIDKFVKDREGKRILVDYYDDVLEASYKNTMIAYYKRDVLPIIFELINKAGEKLESLDDVDFILRTLFMKRKVYFTPYTGPLNVSKKFEELDDASMVDVLSSISMWTTRVFKQSLPKINKP